MVLNQWNSVSSSAIRVHRLDFYQWAIDMELKVVGVDCGAAEHPMNTPIRRWHEDHFKLAEAKLKRETGKTWDETFPQGEYYDMTHINDA